MATGILYLMSTVVPGLIKIGKTGTNNFDNRMSELERNGYNNVVGLRREFAIKVADYSEKEKMLHDIFARNQLNSSELFALNLDLAKQLLSSFEGEQVYPKTESKEQVFDEATEERKVLRDEGTILNGTYTLRRRIKRDNNRVVEATMVIEDGCFTVCKGSTISLSTKENYSNTLHSLRNENTDGNGNVLADVAFRSPSGAGDFVTGESTNGYLAWKDAAGHTLDFYRNK